MNTISDYSGTFLNHMEGHYRPGERALAAEFADALGLAVVEMQFTPTSRPLLAAHFEGDDRDPTNNIVFLFEMPEVQQRVMAALDRQMEQDAELREAMEAYRDVAARMPAIMPHFGIRYRSEAEQAAVVDKLKTGISPELAKRLSVHEAPRYEPMPGLPDIKQVFVRTDVLSIGTAGFQQAIELQAVREG